MFVWLRRGQRSATPQQPCSRRWVFGLSSGQAGPSLRSRASETTGRKAPTLFLPRTQWVMRGRPSAPPKTLWTWLPSQGPGMRPFGSRAGRKINRWNADLRGSGAEYSRAISRRRAIGDAEGEGSRRIPIDGGGHSPCERARADAGAFRGSFTPRRSAIAQVSPFCQRASHRPRALPCSVST